MTRFNIIGTGFLEIDEGSGLGFKAENQFFRFAEISLGRSVEFTVPATDSNRKMLGFGEDPSEWGEMLRTNHACQMVYDGGQKMGTIAVTAFEGEKFKCVFTVGNAEWIDALQSRKLADCAMTWNKGVLWATNSTVVPADAADPSAYMQILQYDHPTYMQPWMMLPSVNVYEYIADILGVLGIPFYSALDKGYWMVAGSMSGGGLDAITMTQTAYDNYSITQVQDYLEVVDIDIEWATASLFGALVGGGTFAGKGFRAKQDLKITFPSTLTPQMSMVLWNKKLSQYKDLAAYFAAMPHDVIVELRGATVEVKKGQTFFFSDKVAMSYTTYYGIQQTDIVATTIQANIVRDSALNFGEVWHIQYNHPDMTVFEFLKSVAVATGLELQVDGVDGVKIGFGSYGAKDDFRSLDRVISVDSVKRHVGSWGSGTRKASIAFDSDDWVTERIRSEYGIDNEQLKDDKNVVAKFSEGNVGTAGVYIEDFVLDSYPYKPKVKKWTLVYSDGNNAYLQRVGTPDPVGYLDIADNSTAVVVKVAAPEADFFSLTPSTTWLWRGMAYVWTDANWSDGVMTLTLQKVSQTS